ncbi:uncharacterized protein LOC143604775 [Bidens hawaiensis]|uniref:uncharacterized protein LOC143604775 n=1 Tax=Bidens hawaiensis TaxID=980011 RepID=UPI004049653C
MADQHQTSDENNELEQLEEDVNLMAQKLTEFRHTLPDQLRTTLASFLSAQRPLNNIINNNPGPSSSNPNPDNGALVEGDLVHAEKIRTIKQKISDNKSAMSSQLKRVEDCMSRVEKLDSFSKGIHPAFKRRTITSKDCFV